MGSKQPFTGILSGTVTFFTDRETIAGNILLDGIGSGVFSATGSTTIVPILPVPEPGTLLLLSSAMLLLGMAQRRRTQS